MDSWATKSDAFFSRIEALSVAYSTNSLAMIAVKNGDEFYVVSGMLRVLNGRSDFPYVEFESPTVIAGHFPLADTGQTPRQIFEDLKAGVLQTPFGPLRFPDNGGNGYSLDHKELHPTRVEADARTELFRMGGENFQKYVAQPNVDWQLKAADQPYDSLEELSIACGLGQLPGIVHFDFVVFNLALIEEASRFEGTQVSPRALVAHGLDEKKVKIGYRVLSDGVVVTRGSVSGHNLSWDRTPPQLSASFDLSVPQGSAVHCIVSYDEVAQHQAWLTDPTARQNLRRATFEPFDGNLEILQKVTKSGVKTGNEAHDFEGAISLILWMLGFNPGFLGDINRLKQGPDILATTPSGHVAVVECTTGRLTDDNKLSKLDNRSASVRKSLDQSGGHHSRVLPVIITSKPRDEVTADLEQAAKQRTLVICQEDILALLDRTSLPHDAEAVFREWEEGVGATYAATHTLDGGTW